MADVCLHETFLQFSDFVHCYNSDIASDNVVHMKLLLYEVNFYTLHALTVHFTIAFALLVGYCAVFKLAWLICGNDYAHIHNQLDFTKQEIFFAMASLNTIGFVAYVCGLKISEKNVTKTRNRTHFHHLFCLISPP